MKHSSTGHIAYVAAYLLPGAPFAAGLFILPSSLVPATATATLLLGVLGALGTVATLLFQDPMDRWWCRVTGYAYDDWWRPAFASAPALLCGVALGVAVRRLWGGTAELFVLGIVVAAWLLIALARLRRRRSGSQQLASDRSA